MTTDARPLTVRGVTVASAEELELLRSRLGDELVVSATLRAWVAGEEVLPHSAAVAVEAQLRMLFGTEPEAATVLEAIIERLASAFPSEVQPLDTT